MDNRQKRIANGSGSVDNTRRGAATVEFAILAPLLILVTLGLIDIGQLINVGQTVSEGSRAGARFAARNKTKTVAEVDVWTRNFFANAYPGVPAKTLENALAIKVLDSTGSPISDGDLTNIDAGSPIIVEVEFEFQSVRWLRGVALGNNRKFNTQTTTCRE